MDENVLQDALNMALGVEELPPVVDPALVDTAATAYATWMFEQQSVNPEDEDAQVAVVRNALASAYIAGRLDGLNSPAGRGVSVETFTGKSGTNVNIYIS